MLARLRHRVQALTRSSPALGHVLTLVTGTAVAQAVSLLMTLVLARQYTPEDFGQLATYTSVAGVVVAVAALRYDMAVMLPKRDAEALALTRRQGPFPARISDVGVVKDLATHDIDLTAWVAGARYTSVAAQVTHRSGRQTEDMMVATGLLEGGIIVSHQVNWLTPFKERVTIVTGEKGSFVADTLTGDLTFHANGTVASTWDQVAAFRGVSEGDVIRYAIPKREPLALEQESFRDAVRGVAQRHVTMAEGVATLDVVEAVLTSASENRTVEL